MLVELKEFEVCLKSAKGVMDNVIRTRSSIFGKNDWSFGLKWLRVRRKTARPLCLKEEVGC